MKVPPKFVTGFPAAPPRDAAGIVGRIYGWNSHRPLNELPFALVTAAPPRPQDPPGRPTTSKQPIWTVARMLNFEG